MTFSTPEGTTVKHPPDHPSFPPPSCMFAFRAFVWMQGHTYTNFKNPQIEATILRGIAWAGHYPVESLVNATPLGRAGGRGRGRQGGGDAPTAPGGRRGGQ